LHGFSGPLGLKWAIEGQNGEEWCDVDPNELVFTFEGSYVVLVLVKIDQKM